MMHQSLCFDHMHGRKVTWFISLAIGLPNIMLEDEQQQQPHNLPQEMNNTTPQSQMRKAAKGKELKSKPRNKNQGRASSSRNDHDQNQPARKKPYHRHSQRQIFEMESFFKECPHPNDDQRKELGQKLGLNQLQIKFWFQNKRTQMKNHHDRHESTHLKTEIEYLHMEINRYKEALSSAMCLTCNGPLTIHEISYSEQQLKLENARLREETKRISEIASKYVGKHMLPQYSVAPPVPSRASLDPPTGSFGMHVSMGAKMYEAAAILQSMPGQPDVEKLTIVELAVEAMDELITLAMLGQPVWTPGYDGSIEILSLHEYVRIFPPGISPKRFGLSSEGTRETAVVAMNHINLVEILIDVNRWAHLFSTIVSKAETLEVLTAGVGGKYNGALQVITAEFQVPTPLVPARESYFARYCKQHGDGTWVVVDVSLDSLRPGGLDRCQRKPSGCVIQEMPNGHSKVTWIEHMEVDNKDIHQMYKTIVSFGLLFGAKRWLATLDRQCQRHAIVMAGCNPGGYGGKQSVGVKCGGTFSSQYNPSAITSQEGRNNILKLGERMVNSFCAGVGASTTHSWTPVSGNGFDDVRVMMKRISDDPGRPSGIVLSASTSFWLPHPNKRVFDYLRSENSRNEVFSVFKAWGCYFFHCSSFQWDILASEGTIEEIANIENGREPGNNISLLSIKCSESNYTNMLLLQECCTDPTGSLVIYAPTDIDSMNMVLSGGNPDYVALLPSGFSLFPDGAGGSILTVTIQILVDSASTGNLSIASIMTIDNLISCTIEKMKVLIRANA